MKGTWTKPQLITLVRGTPEEAVLIACKLATPGQSAPNFVGTACICPTGDGAGSCAQCETTSNS